MATFGHWRAVSGISFIICGGTFCPRVKPRMSDANKDLSLFWIFLLLTMSVNSNLVQLINISKDKSRFKQINFSESSDFQQLRCSPLADNYHGDCLCGDFFVWLDDLNQASWWLGKFTVKSWNILLFAAMFLSDRYDWFKSSNIRKKIAVQISLWLLLPSGEMPLVMKTNRKILPSQDSNLSCYSPSILTFSAPTFCLSSFMILMGGRIPFPNNTDIFYVMVAKGMTEESTPLPPCENCAQQTAPWRLPPSKLPWGGWVRVGVRQFTGGNFLRSKSPSSSHREATFQG